VKQLPFFLVKALLVGISAAQVKDSVTVKTEIITQAKVSVETETETNTQLKDSAVAEAEIIAKDSSKKPIRICTLTVDVNPANGGTVSRNPDKEAYVYGDTVNLTAAPEDGYTFTGWTGATTNRRNQLTIMMNSDKRLTATFYKKLYIEPKPVTMPVTQERTHTGMSATDDGSGTSKNSKDNRDGHNSNASALFTSLSTAYAFPGAYVSYNFRKGYRKFDDVDGYVPDDNTNPVIIGLSIGRRISINNPRLRLQALFELGRGSVKDGEYEIPTNLGPTWVSMHSVYWTGGLLADAHLLLPVNERTHFVSAGLGAHFTYFDIAYKVLATGEDIKNKNNDMRGALSPSVNLGYGVEYKREGSGAVCISYNLRFWRSASYKEAGGLFPMGVNYTEFFFSHSIQVQYLLPPRKKNNYTSHN
jgi:uncharacterized repeat protein (TIGR02543 family)